MAKNIDVKTTKKVVPMIYAWTTPDIPKYDGWIKIGYTEQDVAKRIQQTASELHIQKDEQWRGMAVFDDGSGDRFTDHDFHRYLKKKEYKHKDKEPHSEWFETDGDTSHKEFIDFKSNRGVLETLVGSIIDYTLRDEQTKAVEETELYMRNGSNNVEFLWNCKPRFGKTLTVYDFMKKIDAHNILIITNRPAIANSWYSDYEQFIGTDKYHFVTNSGYLYGKPYVLSAEEYRNFEGRIGDDDLCRQIKFVSLQDLKGSKYFGGDYNKLKEVAETNWDLLVIDESHEGVDTYKTDKVLDRISRNFTLHLSGTPFKALSRGKFGKEAIYNFTYVDEQTRKRDWDYSKGENPYEVLPKLNLFTYKMSEIVRDEVEQGITINDEVEEYAFDLNEFFATNESGAFIHSEAVDKFLDALTTQMKFPFSTPELRDELKHTFWYLNRIDSAKALERKLKYHPVFKDYFVVSAVGTGKDNEEQDSKNNFDRVRMAIENHDKTITLSVGQLTTGVTIPEWTAVLMLCNLESAPLYVQAAFRAQNPCLFIDGENAYRKENAYVFDFDPARTLIVYEDFATNQFPDTAGGKGTTETRKKQIKELLNFFPVLGEDENGEMIELDAEKVLTIPRKIKSQEVVKRGFMSNFLFDNISSIFQAPKEIMDILNKMQPTEEGKEKKIEKPTDLKPTDENGNVVVEIGDAKDIFGDKIFGNAQDIIEDMVERSIPNASDVVKQYTEALVSKIVEPVCETINEKFEEEIKQSDKKQVERVLTTNVEIEVKRIVDDFNIDKKIIEQEKEDELQNRFESGKTTEQIEKEFDEKITKAEETFKENMSNSIKEIAETSCTTAVSIIETKVQNRKNETVEDNVRNHLRGFARTIPSFLMAFGDENTTLENFDTIVPADVFEEVTRNISTGDVITLDEFRLLRDGGTFKDGEGNEKQYPGLFNAVVFNDSIKEFLKKKDELSNYFDESATEDIFNYIPPQKTNQIYTPKKVVIDMVDMLEKENPGCFDDDSKTFADLYMKSGLYIAEIVKRLFRSETMKSKYPDDKERLKHIFAKQVYGLAPTEIIYNIAKNFILGFDKDGIITEYNLKMCDPLPYAEEGTLEDKLDEIFKKN